MNTKTFLSHFPDFCIQTFDDNDVAKEEKDRSLVVCEKPNHFKSRDEIVALNKRGAGIYFSPNQFPTGVRQAKLCQGINAWIVENDDLPLEEQYKNFADCPVPPSFLVESKNSVHGYWLAKNGTIENYRRIVSGLIKHFKADTSNKDVSRVFRIPGFYHMKDRDDPKLVEIAHAAPELVYEEEYMLASFPYTPPVSRAVYTQRPLNKDDLWSLLGSLDNKTMLERLSAFPIINNETITFSKRNPDGEYILVNGKMCDAWLDKEGMIGSGKGGGPTWVQWLRFYGKSKAEIAEWAKSYIPEVQDWVRENETEKIEAQIKKAEEPIEEKDYKLRYTWGTKGMDSSFAIIKRANFIVMGAKRNSGKTTFTFDMAIKNAIIGHRVLYLSLEMDEKMLLDDFGRKYAGITIDEERDYQIPDRKQKAYNRRLSEIKSVENLVFKGVRRGGGITWDVVTELIGDDDWDLVFIDNLDLIQGEDREHDLEKQKRIVKNIMAFTSDRQIPIVLVHHHRKSMAKSDFGSDELSGSGKIGDSADIIVKISRNTDPEAEYPEKYKSTVRIQKGRGYGEAVKDVYFIKGTFMDDFPIPDQEIPTMSIENMIKTLT